MKKRILVVDDDPAILEYVTQILQSEHEVETAANANEAIEKLRTQEPFDLVLLDIELPDGTGYDVLSALRKSSQRDVPVVIVTCETRDEDVLRGYRQGADYYITKPFSPNRIANAVKFFIGDLPEQHKEELAAEL